MITEELKPMDIGGVFDKTFRLITSNAKSFIKSFPVITLSDTIGAYDYRVAAVYAIVETGKQMLLILKPCCVSFNLSPHPKQNHSNNGLLKLVTKGLKKRKTLN